MIKNTDQVSRTAVNQIRGITVSGSTGAGIPKHVTDVSATMTNAQTGSTSTVTVTFRRDPTDRAYGGVSVWVKGYQSNQTPVQIARSTDSPITFVLTNTGEALSISVQAFGNGGVAPITTAPTCGVTLPKSSSGGVGTGTVLGLSSVVNDTNVTGSFASGTLTLGWTGQLALSRGGTGSNLSATGGTSQVLKQTSAGAAVTVGQLATADLSDITTSSPKEGDVLRYSVTDGKYMRDLYWDFIAMPNGTTGTTGLLHGISNTAIASTAAYSQTGTLSVVNGTATELVGLKLTSSSAAGTQLASWMPTAAAVAGCLGIIRRVRFRLALAQTTAMRMFIGLGSLAAANDTTFNADVPNTPFIGFRYSTNVPDSKYQCVTQTSNANSTINAETTSSHVDTATHTFDLIWDGTNITFYIDDVQVGRQSSNMPATSQALQPMVHLDNVASAAAKAWTLYYMKGNLAIL